MKRVVIVLWFLAGGCVDIGSLSTGEVAVDMAVRSKSSDLALSFPACADGIKNGNETDVDCGGTCGKCAQGKACSMPSDCATAVCTNNVCGAPAASCSDGKKNGNETDIDCGGPQCPRCANGQGCQGNADCAAMSCVNGVCGPPLPTCMDGKKNGNETDVDCGGPDCRPCGDNLGCNMNSDCQSQNCLFNSCVPANNNCKDGVKNGSETDVDCGGSCPTPCNNGKMCRQMTDCKSWYCNQGTCFDTCHDGMQQGFETDVDCGGYCNACMTGKKCRANADCVGRVCFNQTCL